MSGDSPKLDSLSDPDRMLDAVGAWQSAGMLRRLFNALTPGAEAAEAVVAKPKPSQQPGPN
jgi:hypothetical protein